MKKKAKTITDEELSEKLRALGFWNITAYMADYIHEVEKRQGQIDLKALQLYCDGLFKEDRKLDRIISDLKQGDIMREPEEKRIKRIETIKELRDFADQCIEEVLHAKIYPKETTFHEYKVDNIRIFNGALKMIEYLGGDINFVEAEDEDE